MSTREYGDGKAESYDFDFQPKRGIRGMAYFEFPSILAAEEVYDEAQIQAELGRRDLVYRSPSNRLYTAEEHVPMLLEIIEAFQDNGEREKQ